MDEPKIDLDLLNESIFSTAMSQSGAFSVPNAGSDMTDDEYDGALEIWEVQARDKMAQTMPDVYLNRREYFDNRLAQTKDYYSRLNRNKDIGIVRDTFNRVASGLLNHTIGDSLGLVDFATDLVGDGTDLSGSVASAAESVFPTNPSLDSSAAYGDDTGLIDARNLLIDAGTQGASLIAGPGVVKAASYFTKAGKVNSALKVLGKSLPYSQVVGLSHQASSDAYDKVLQDTGDEDKASWEYKKQLAINLGVGYIPLYSMKRIMGKAGIPLPSNPYVTKSKFGTVKDGLTQAGSEAIEESLQTLLSNVSMGVALGDTVGEGTFESAKAALLDADNLKEVLFGAVGGAVGGGVAGAGTGAIFNGEFNKSVRDYRKNFINNARNSKNDFFVEEGSSEPPVIRATAKDLVDTDKLIEAYTIEVSRESDPKVKNILNEEIEFLTAYKNTVAKNLGAQDAATDRESSFQEALATQGVEVASDIDTQIEDEAVKMNEDLESMLADRAALMEDTTATQADIDDLDVKIDELSTLATSPNALAAKQDPGTLDQPTAKSSFIEASRNVEELSSKLPAQSRAKRRDIEGKEIGLSEEIKELRDLKKQVLQTAPGQPISYLNAKISRLSGEIDGYLASAPGGPDRKRAIASRRRKILELRSQVKGIKGSEGRVGQLSYIDDQLESKGNQLKSLARQKAAIGRDLQDSTLAQDLEEATLRREESKQALRGEVKGLKKDRAELGTKVRQNTSLLKKADSNIQTLEKDIADTEALRGTVRSFKAGKGTISSTPNVSTEARDLIGSFLTGFNSGGDTLVVSKSDLENTELRNRLEKAGYPVQVARKALKPSKRTGATGRGLYVPGVGKNIIAFSDEVANNVTAENIETWAHEGAHAAIQDLLGNDTTGRNTEQAELYSALDKEFAKWLQSQGRTASSLAEVLAKVRQPVRADVEVNTSREGVTAKDLRADQARMSNFGGFDEFMAENVAKALRGRLTNDTRIGRFFNKIADIFKSAYQKLKNITEGERDYVVPSIQQFIQDNFDYARTEAFLANINNESPTTPPTPDNTPDNTSNETISEVAPAMKGLSEVADNIQRVAEDTTGFLNRLVNVPEGIETEESLQQDRQLEENLLAEFGNPINPIKGLPETEFKFDSESKDYPSQEQVVNKVFQRILNDPNIEQYTKAALARFGNKFHIRRSQEMTNAEAKALFVALSKRNIAEGIETAMDLILNPSSMLKPDTKVKLYKYVSQALNTATNDLMAEGRNDLAKALRATQTKLINGYIALSTNAGQQLNAFKDNVDVMGSPSGVAYGAARLYKSMLKQNGVNAKPMSEARLAKIIGLAETYFALPKSKRTETAKNNLSIDINNEISSELGTDGVGLAIGLVKTSLFTPETIGINAISTALNVTGTMMARLMTRPGRVGALNKEGLIEAFYRGATQATNVLKEKDLVRSFEKFETGVKDFNQQVRSLSDAFKESYKKIADGTATKYDWLRAGFAGGLYLPSRVLNETILKPMRATDQLLHGFVTSLSLRQIAAYEALKADKTLSNDELRNRVNKALGGESFQSFRDKARAALGDAASNTEVNTEAFAMMSNAMDPDLVESAEKFAAIATFNDKSETALGHIARQARLLEFGGRKLITRAEKNLDNIWNGEGDFLYKVSQFGAMALQGGAGGILLAGKTIYIPFTSIIANVADSGLEYTPVGFAKAKFAKINAESDNPRTALAEGMLRSDQIAKATIGTGAMLAFIAMAFDQDDEEKEVGPITFYGKANMFNYDERRDLGIQDYSIRAGNLDIPLRDTPFLYMFAPAMNVAEKLRELKRKDLTPEQRQEQLDEIAEYASYALGASFNSLRAISESTMLTGLANLSDLIRGEESAGAKFQQQVASFAGTIASGIGTLGTAGYLRTLEDWTATEKDFKSKSMESYFWRRIPFVRTSDQVDIDRFGDPAPHLPLDRFPDFKEEVPEHYKFMRDNDVYFAGIDSNWASSFSQESVNRKKSGEFKELAQERIDRLGAVAAGRATREELIYMTKEVGPKLKEAILELAPKADEMTRVQIKETLGAKLSEFKKEAKLKMLKDLYGEDLDIQN